MIVFIIYDVNLNEDVLKVAATEYLGEEAEKNNHQSVVLNFAVNFGMGIIMLFIIQLKVIRPLN